MGSWSKALLASTLDPLPSFPSSSTPHLSFLTNFSSSSSYSSPFTRYSLSFPFKNSTVITLKNSSTYPTPLLLSFSSTNFICKAAEYKFPDPIPEFADAETDKFRTHLLKKLSKKDIYGDSVEEVVGICTEIFSTFLHAEYGGPGTLLVIPFIDMADTLNERGLPGGPQAARAAVKWAQDHVDKDWKEWNSSD
ncbi:LOW QUALITY PROTEIN: protein PLASTID REDOX INSENSITIVE 2-like [Durio zibethinus]|uniref:LOW QUALITY PROTEIN: protein PLASTID REDOX INSENSITIVE 2-like n=1 Tax=Durio zibethinus TaxID=66656 RepID=A0A6P5XHM9_DURZI|nr:LOW QUALITY PROTEIN: protein PLASTID REDOX INSENSITIVE 2-like [Durio zibethinus]